ncbi:hypothetical protein P3T37_004386 [Kitasatospora sp. MAA4]|uniref:hypothetical protein n=1 Tax=Kitasatospora sp. MAA4 TaxID=3035093 RepID=UPI002474C6CC|nr:hypothetical protein [Kitasatospora sp. MAA4]MDH6134976.1 hypothetical protein [Kitasatospora sp. MAA4]
MTSSTSAKTAQAIIGLAIGALALTACGPDTPDPTPTKSASSQPSSGGGFGGGSTGGDSSTPSAVSTPSSAPTAAPAPAGGGGGATATAGQSFKIGQAATLPFSYGSTKGTISLTVTSIQMGASSDLDSLKLGDQVKGMVPYYIHYSVKNVGNTDLSFSTVDHMKGLLPDGTDAQDLMLIGTFDKCPNDSLPSGFTNGQTAQGCSVSLAPSSAVKVASAEYWGDPFTMDKGLYWK